MKFVHAIEGLSLWTGRAFGWCILILTLSVSYEVFVRYVLNAPTVWAFDMMIQMYGALFLMCGAYALAQDTHVRADVIYRLLPVRAQAGLDFVLYFLFFFPGVLALVWFGVIIAEEAWFRKEVSFNSPAGIQIYFFKSLIPLAGALLLLQGAVELVRCVKAFRTGVWPERLEDVKETEDLLSEADVSTIAKIKPGKD
jgi:TRAP-type mannitol/chloroaromatic compound transport system permease small subunit